MLMVAGRFAPLDQQTAQRLGQQPIGRIADPLQEIEQAEKRGQRGEFGSGQAIGRTRRWGSGLLGGRWVRVIAVQPPTCQPGGLTNFVWCRTAPPGQLCSPPPGRRQGWPGGPHGPRTRSFQVEREQIVVENLVLFGFVLHQVFDLVAELFDRVFLVAELFHVALVKIAVAVELLHVLADAVLFFGDRLELLFELLSAGRRVGRVRLSFR